MHLLNYILIQILEIYTVIVVINVILSWAVLLTQSYQVRRAYWWSNRLVDPVLAPIRRLLYPYTRNLGIDFSPFILIILLQLLQRMLRF